MYPRVWVKNLVPGDMVSLQSVNVYDLLIVLSTIVDSHKIKQFKLTLMWIWMDKKLYTDIRTYEYVGDTSFFYLVSRADMSRATTQAEVVE